MEGLYWGSVPRPGVGGLCLSPQEASFFFPCKGGSLFPRGGRAGRFRDAGRVVSLFSFPLVPGGGGPLPGRARGPLSPSTGRIAGKGLFFLFLRDGGGFHLPPSGETKSGDVGRV